LQVEIHWSVPHVHYNDVLARRAAAVYLSQLAEKDTMRKFELGLLFALLTTLIACQGSPSKPASSAAPAPAAPKKEEQPAVAYTGREAFQKMYTAAHLWAPDARPYNLQSSPFKDHTGKDGKAVIWRAGFASPTRRYIKAFLWSGAHSEDAPSPGVSSGTEDTYNPRNSSTQVFDPAFLKTDSDKAFEMAEKHGGEKLTKANPKQPIVYLLDWNSQENILTWHVMYGTGPSDAKLKVAINASTGGFERVEK
jgi:hypothetical protein